MTISCFLACFRSSALMKLKNFQILQENNFNRKFLHNAP